MKVKVELNFDGVRDGLLKSPEMIELLRAYGEKIRENCNLGTVGPDEYSTRLKIGARRASVTVYPNTRHAYYSNLKHNTIEHAVEAVRE